MVESEREIPATAKDPAKIEREARFYITSLVWLAVLVAPAIRGHWMIEDGLHWMMDMMFRDDECRVRTENAPANFTTIKHMALNLIRLKSSGKKDFLKTRRFVASWDYLASSRRGVIFSPDSPAGGTGSKCTSRCGRMQWSGRVRLTAAGAGAPAGWPWRSRRERPQATPGNS
jgi:hypothetical protein